MTMLNSTTVIVRVMRGNDQREWLDNSPTFCSTEDVTNKSGSSFSIIDSITAYDSIYFCQSFSSTIGFLARVGSF